MTPLVHIQVEGMTYQDEIALFMTRPVLLGWRGSKAHGTYIAPSDPDGVDDKDLIGVYIPTAVDAYLGLSTGPPKGHQVQRGKWDVVNYELRHFVGLAMKSNPESLSLLFMKRGDILVCEREGEWLRENRDLFPSKRAFGAFGGYARGMMKEARDFNPTVAATWGEKRRALRVRHGYDTKAAAHAIRLLLMGTELFKTGEFTVDRREAKDAEVLVQIKKGHYTYAGFMELFEDLQSDFVKEANASNLPEDPPIERIEKLLTSLLCYALAPDIAFCRTDWIKTSLVRKLNRESAQGRGSAAPLGPNDPLL